jgi:hypothetical protein
MTSNPHFSHAAPGPVDYRGSSPTGLGMKKPALTRDDVDFSTIHTPYYYFSNRNR